MTLMTKTRKEGMKLPLLAEFMGLKEATIRGTWWN